AWCSRLRRLAEDAPARFACKKKAAPPGTASFEPKREDLLLDSEDRVLRLLRDAKLDHPLRGNLDLFARGRVATHARLPIDEHELSDARDREAVLRFLVGES